RPSPTPLHPYPTLFRSRAGRPSSTSPIIPLNPARLSSTPPDASAPTCAFCSRPAKRNGGSMNRVPADHTESVPVRGFSSDGTGRSEEHTSELQSPYDIV